MATTWSTRHFEEWEDQLSQAIGHHSSTLLTPEVPFCSSITVRQAEGVAAVSLEGKSSLRLHRWQCMKILAVCFFEWVAVSFSDVLCTISAQRSGF
jgi:hypothetical protein